MSRTRQIRNRGSVRPVTERPEQRVSETFLDRNLSHYRDGMRWSFEDGKILLDGFDVNRLLTDARNDIAVWMGVAGGLDDYRKKVLAQTRRTDQFSRFDSVIEALLGKISGQLKRIYDEKTTGLSWTIQNGQFILNGINVRSFLALYRVRKTEKARRFLEGLKEKLNLLLGNPDHEKIRGTIQELLHEVDQELEEAPRPPGDPHTQRRLGH